MSKSNKSNNKSLEDLNREENLGATEAKLEESKVVAKKEKKKGKELIGYLGGRLVVQVNERPINGKKFNDCILADGTGILLSDKDLQAQLKDEQGELKY